MDRDFPIWTKQWWTPILNVDEACEVQGELAAEILLQDFSKTIAHNICWLLPFNNKSKSLGFGFPLAGDQALRLPQPSSLFA